MYGPGYRIYLRGSARTNTGRVRQNNEDSVHLWAHDHSMMAVVADGMGGAAAGEEASRLAIETIQQTMANEHYKSPEDYHTLTTDELAEKLRDVVIDANYNIVARAERFPEFKGMGTTLTMAFARDTDVILAHVGDSRAYLVNGNNGDIIQLTADHSFVQALVDAGHITPEEAERHPMKNVLYRALGQGDDIEVDIHRDLHLNVGDRLVLCSDGLTLHVKAYEIADIVMEEQDPAMCSERLIELANSRGGRDNISVIAIYFEKFPIKPARDAATHEDDIITLVDDDDEPTVLIRDRSALMKQDNSDETPRNSTVEVSYSETDGEGRDIFEPDQ